MPKRRIVDFGANMAGYGQSPFGGFLGGLGNSLAAQSANNQQVNSMKDMLEAQLRSQADAIAAGMANDAASLSATTATSPVVGDLRYDINGRVNYFTQNGVWEIINDSLSVENSAREAELRQREADYRASREWASYQQTAWQRAAQQAAYDPRNYLMQNARLPLPPDTPRVASVAKPTVETIERKPRVIEFEAESE